ncbi:HAD family hydrolase [Corynebacterium sp. MSK297]|uniref:HAD family hydrolase n=1 Tax=Corynebacterium sp. MSK297 TaxID=3050221 RepID=UPI00254D63E0|nr:HAD family hydrolase [Corynebacterium sp. MSK297]MDK8845398.1 HAD family hydrolase [Corynebacterium sp. MSK297]
MHDPHSTADQSQQQQPLPQPQPASSAFPQQSPQASSHPNPHPQPQRGRVAAFFDLDKTIIATSSAFAYGREFLHNGLITPQDALSLSLAKASYMFAGQSSAQMDSTRDQLTSMITGWSEKQVRDIVHETMHTVLTPAIYSEARELIQAHQEAGHEVIIISASARQLVEPIAKELGITEVISTELEIVDGAFTGTVEFYCKGGAKADAITALVDERGYDLKHSYAYSDSATDAPMLELVGYPVAVNPDRALKKIALERSWEIRSFKDPAPLFQLPGAKEIGIGAGVLAGIVALVTAGTLLTKFYAHDKPAKPDKPAKTASESSTRAPAIPMPKGLDWRFLDCWFKKSSA